MVVKRIQVDLVQKSFNTLRNREGARREWRKLEVTIESRFAEAVAGSNGQFLAEQLVEREQERFLLEPEILREARRRIGIRNPCGAICQSAHQSIGFGPEQLGVHAEIGR